MGNSVSPSPSQRTQSQKEKVTPKHDASGFSDKEKKQIAKACVAALPMVTKALAKIAKGNGHYRKWMDDGAKSDATGSDVDQRIDHVRAGLEKDFAAISSPSKMPTAHRCNTSGCRSSGRPHKTATSRHSSPVR